mmetsp:Transcript_10037/g.15285  ORF Transcript_10037/g.15285 Transcript_10037/m.15285 type:complete len:111 (+) Transcript_10037:788-1120(+)
MTQKQKAMENDKQIKAICFGAKVLEEMLAGIGDGDAQEVAQFYQDNLGDIIEVVCLTCEQHEEIVVMQGQITSKLVMMAVLDLKLKAREQFEILYTKCVLKPVISRIKKA